MFRHYRHRVKLGVFDGFLDATEEKVSRHRSAGTIDSSKVHAHGYAARIKERLA